MPDWIQQSPLIEFEMYECGSESEPTANGCQAIANNSGEMIEDSSDKWRKFSEINSEYKCMQYWRLPEIGWLMN